MVRAMGWLRALRYASWCSLIVAPLIVGTARLGAQSPRHDSTVVTVAGSGPTTYVLLSGLVGGVAGFRRLQAALVERGQRVIVIDPYRLAVDSSEVTFVALARYVDALLAEYGVDSAQLVGHAHGAGVALRLAANSPRRVSGLFLLDVGALEENRTKVFSSSLRLVPLIARLPGGRGFVRRRYVRGLRQNAAREEWLDAATERAYTEPFLDNLSRVVAMAGRLANAREPESRLTTVSRVRVPVTVLLGAVPHPAGPDSAELDVLAPLGGLLRIERLAGVSHFPHEEATADVATRLLAPRNESRQNGHPEW
jgi:pimeloyl-ACP methyl ester carboxylesterase